MKGQNHLYVVLPCSGERPGRPHADSNQAKIARLRALREMLKRRTNGAKGSLAERRLQRHKALVRNSALLEPFRTYKRPSAYQGGRLQSKLSDKEQWSCQCGQGNGRESVGDRQLKAQLAVMHIRSRLQSELALQVSGADFAVICSSLTFFCDALIATMWQLTLSLCT